MKTKMLIIGTLLFIVPLLMAMGGMQGQSPEKIPVPAKKFLATYIDQTDTVTDCRDASIAGETFLEGRRGNGTSAIPFENIQEVSFLSEGENLYGLIKLRDGSTVKLALNKNQLAYGRTQYGTFQIRLADLKRMTLRKS